MSGGNREVSTQRVLVPQAPVLVAGFREVLWLSPDGEVEALAPAEARSRVERETPMLCHARATARRLEVPIFPALDLLELFAFVRPARFCVPTPRGLAAALGLDLPRRPAEACVTLATAARALLEDGETTLATLDLARYEVANVAVRAWRAPESVAPLLATIERLADDGGVLKSTGDLLARAAELAERHTISVYDAAYASASGDAGHRLVSCDERDLVSNGLAVAPAAARAE